MKYSLHQTDKLLKDVEENLKKYCENHSVPDCLSGRLRLIIEPDENFLHDISDTIKNLKEIIKLKPGIFVFFAFHIKDVKEDKILITFKFDKKSLDPSWDVEYL